MTSDEPQQRVQQDPFEPWDTVGSTGTLVLVIAIAVPFVLAARGIRKVWGWLRD